MITRILLKIFLTKTVKAIENRIDSEEQIRIDEIPDWVNFTALFKVTHKLLMNIEKISQLQQTEKIYSVDNK